MKTLYITNFTKGNAIVQLKDILHGVARWLQENIANSPNGKYSFDASLQQI